MPTGLDAIAAVTTPFTASAIWICAPPAGDRFGR